MLQKQMILTKCCGIFIAALLLLSGCGEKKTKTDKKTETPPKIDKSIKTVKSGKIKPANVVINPSFEEAKVFDSGLYKKGKTPVKKPVGWTTKNQILSDSKGWVSEEAHTGKHSLKIKNIGGTDAYWQGRPVVLTQEANSFEISVWTKTKQIAKNITKGRFQIFLLVYAKDINGREVMVKNVVVDIPKVNHDWKKTSKKVLVAEKISRIVPYIYFSGIVGTVWIDDLYIKPYNDKGKVLFDSNVKDSLTGKFKVISAGNKEKIYKVIGSQQIMSKVFIPVGEDKTYKLSGTFKSSGKTKSLIYFGFVPYDKNKTFINNYSVKYREKTETELAQKCTLNDKVIWIKDASYWIEGAQACIAFDVDTSGKYADLPNFNYSSRGIKRISFDGEKTGYWKIELASPCRRAYPAGTKIREHVPDASGTYLYSAASYVKVPDNWTEYKGIINKNNKRLFKKFHPGTRYVKIFMLLNFQQAEDTSIEFKNMELKEF